MKKILLKTMLLLCALVVGSNAWGQTWERVTSIQTLFDGGTFIMGYEATAKSGVIVPLRSKDCGATTTANGYFNTGTTNNSSTDGTIDMSNLSGVTTSDYEVYITGVKKNNVYTYINIQRNNNSGNYYGASSGGSSKNTGRLYTSGGSNETNLTPEWSSETNNQFNLTANVSGSYKYLKYNTSNPRFAFYTNHDGKIVFYKKTLNITSLSVGTAPTKVNYKVGETLDLTGLVLNADGNDVTSGYTASPANGATLNTVGAQTVTFTYGGQTTTQTIHVGDLESIALTTTGVKTTYDEGQSFNPDNLVVTATYSDGESTPTEWEETVDVSDCTFDPDGALATTDDNVEVSYTYGETTKTANIAITVTAGVPYTVTFDAGNGTCATASIGEASFGAGVTLPTATISVAGWEFVGWAESAISNASTRPTLYAAESTYYPTANITLHAVFALADAIDKYAMATSNSDIVDGAKVVISSLGNNKYTLANNNGTLTGITNFTPTDGVITCNNTQAIWTLAISNGNVTIANGGKYLKRSSSSTTVSVDENSYNWTINESNLVSDRFLVKDASAKYYLEHDGTSWTAFYSNNSPSQNATSGYVGLTIYVEKPNKYDSSPSALVTPTVTFGSSDPVTLYLDGTTTHTNTATKSGSNMAIVYSSSDTSVATVTSEGVVTAKGIGTATITASVEAELGVSTSASDTYIVTVKNATTLAGIKAVATNSAATNFTADLASDLVITYVNSPHAYLQSGDVAVYASCATGDWDVGKKFNGAISGQVKKLNNEYQITAINQTPVAGGVVPDAIEVAITDLTTANYATYEGRKIAINGATIHTAMTSTATSGGKITTDGTNTLNIYSREKGITLTKDEKGNFIGYIGRYNDGIRYYMYEQSQFTKTHNVPQNQDMSFATPAYNLDEETAAVTAFNGQAVTQTTVKGAVTYSIKDGSEDITTSLDASTGAVVLNGSRGTATIVATAAAAEETDGEGYITPYNELSVEYTITVRPRYTVTFSVNGVETSVREESFNAGVEVPANPSEIGAYSFQGWSNATVATTDTKPTLASLTAGNNYKPSDEETYYAVYAIQAQTGTTDVLDQSYSYSEGNWTVGGDAEDKISSSYLLLHQGGYVESATFDLSIISKVVVYGGTYGGDSNSSLRISDGTNVWKNVTVVGSSNTGKNEFTDGNALTGNGKLRVTSTCGGTTNGVRITKFEIYKLGPVYGYKGYTTSTITNVTRSMVAGKIGTICLPYAVKAAAVSNAKVYTVAGKTMDGSGNLQYVTISELEGDMTAGVPYIIKATTDNPTFFYVEENPAANASSFHGLVGSFTETKINPNEGNYIFSGGLLYLVDSEAYVGANRAYIHLEDVLPNASSVKGINIFADGVDPTAISAPYTTIQSGVYYNLQGQRVENPTHGIYILNGKKVFIK